ncbi:unnamed protein product [Mytilus edulis]|uniref:Uncharacterized protein n=1 Tax=Mytilus edulis TaxID=6550 RepID=A0A8S3UY47_MYTED|nr:unnamed protein product [Mytilus edulis]
MDQQWSLYGIVCVILWFFVPSEAKFIRFKPGYEYEYKFESNAQLTDYGNFNIKAKISFTNIDEKYGYQEILLRIYSFTFYAKDPGPHNATYTVKETSTGLQFTKVRHEPLVKNAGGKYQKVMHYHKDLEVIHSVLIEEDFISPSRPSAKFNALHGMRKIKAVNEFSTMEFPEMKAISKGSLSYLTRRFERDAVTKPMLGLEESTIHVTKNMIAAMEDLVFNKENHPEEMYKEDLHERVLLCLGSVSHKLSKVGREEEAIKITVRVHQWLGIHDPFEYRKKRAIQSEQEQIDYDHWRVILLETLGNARMDFSFEYIVSHINSTNSAWIKRAGVHALRKYEHEMAADEMYKAAMYDENDEVRYEALLQYQAHPQARIITPLKAREEVNGTGIIDPYESGIMEIAPQRREKRSLGFLEKFPKINFRLEAPSVDWRKMLGSETIGAAFGIIMYNMLDLKIEPLSGHLRINVHDEAYARVLLGILDFNLDFFVARLCFKGGTQYNLNILQVCWIKNTVF